MATGQAAAKAGQRKETSEPHKDDDRGPGSCAGNLTRDPELHYTDGGTAVANLRVAYTERVQDAKTHEWSDGPTVYYDIVTWGRLAERVCEHLSRGDRIVAEGRWRSNTFEDKNGDIQERIQLSAKDLGPSMAFRGARVLPKDNGGGR